MFGNLFSSIGSSIGAFFGDGIFSTIGRFAGGLLGKYLDQSMYDVEEYERFYNIHESFKYNTAKYGQTIPLVFGYARVDGKIIWTDQVKEVTNCNTEKKYFETFNQVKSKTTTIECEYFISLAIAICEGEIKNVIRVWANNDLIDLSKYQHRIYHGTPDQNPDPTIENILQKPVPAFRDIAYIVFTDLPLSDFNNSIPVFSFEVIRKANIINKSSVEDLVESIVIIPGSGEFIYDTCVQYKTIIDGFDFVISKDKINSNNHQNIADSVYSLNQLQTICSNLKWVSPVACWFCNSLDIANCSIMPAVEFNDESTHFSEHWQVSRYIRSNAYVISKDEQDKPLYGGSVNDNSVIRYLKEIKSRNLKIMFYPMIFVDIPGKPWRGYITGAVEHIHSFFNKEKGYNNFILHYTNLVKDYVDAFVIGSELIGLTKLRNHNNEFPAVKELCNLARQVKEIVGSNVLVTYAADWSEYHHTEGGWYNLDELWASDYIDFIGIDAYFPVTNNSTSNIDYNEIIQGYNSGEGYDYYISGENKYPLDLKYAWKNIKYFWENQHINPDNKITQWKPKMKKIWFTEFGFPSIDKATNQPNIFFDLNCINGGIPKYSTGNTDFAIQRKAIKAFIEYWKSQPYIHQMFLWTWDARPYPAWPCMKIWSDGYLWEKGHWVNNKFGTVAISSIILELSMRAGINNNKIDVSTLDEAVEGVIFTQDISIMNAINILRIGYFFDVITSSYDLIKFIKRSSCKEYFKISKEMLLELSQGTFLKQKIICKSDILSSIHMSFIDKTNDYFTNHSNIFSEHNSNKQSANINLPFVLSIFEAERLCNLIIKNANIENKIITFALLITELYYEPTDFISLNYQNKNYKARIINIELKNRIQLIITAIVDDINSYYLPNKIDDSNNYKLIEYKDSKLFIIEPHILLNGIPNEPHVLIFYYGKSNSYLYATLSDDYQKVAKLSSAGDIGYYKVIENNKYANCFLIDEKSKFLVHHSNFEKYTSLNNWNLALIDEEFIKFKKYDKVGHNTYQIGSIIRGCYCTENLISKHNVHGNFILLNSYALALPISSDISGFNIHFMIDNITKTIKFQNTLSSSLPRVFIKYCKIKEQNLYLELLLRTNSANIKFSQIAEKYKLMLNISCSNNFSYNEILLQSIINLNIGDYTLSDVLNISIIIINDLGQEDILIKKEYLINDILNDL